MNVLVTGANGFIGHHLVRALLDGTDWNVVAVDVQQDRLAAMEHRRLRILDLDVVEQFHLVGEVIRGADVVVHLAGVATPQAYVTDPLYVFQQDFEAALSVVKACAQFNIRLIFPSSSEVYGCADVPFKEDETGSVYGPVKASRWIYACSKQLIDRVIAAYGQDRTWDLQYTIFRPFNWIGPGLDSPGHGNSGSARVVTAFIGQILRGEKIKLVNGGHQRRCFTWVGDGIDALMRILRSNDVDGEIINIGAPENETTINELALNLWRLSGELLVPWPEAVEGKEFYGAGYEDIPRRVPCIDKARKLLGWEPTVGLDEALRRTVEWAKGEVPS